MIITFIMKTQSSLSLKQEWLSKLQVGGYRLTRPFKIIIEVLSEATHALNPIEIFDRGRIKSPKMGLMTVYRSLEKMEKMGLIQRVHQTNGCNAYIHAANGHEHILLCTQCGRVVYFAGEDISPLINRVTHQSGFSIQDHWLQLYGICAECQKLPHPSRMNEGKE